MQSQCFECQVLFFIIINKDIIFSKFIFYFFIAVQLQLSLFFPHYSPLPYSRPPPTFNTPPRIPHCPYPWVLCTCPLTWTFPFFPPWFPFPLLSGHCQVCYFHVSGFILLTCLFCWLGPTYMWDNMVFDFQHLSYFTLHNTPNTL